MLHAWQAHLYFRKFDTLRPTPNSENVNLLCPETLVAPSEGIGYSLWPRHLSSTHVGAGAHITPTIQNHML